MYIKPRPNCFISHATNVIHDSGKPEVRANLVFLKEVRLNVRAAYKETSPEKFLLPSF